MPLLVLQSLAILLFCAAPPPVSAFLIQPSQYPQGMRSCMMNKMRGYYTISEENGNGWSLFQDGIEGAVFLGNRVARRHFASGFSTQGSRLASPLKMSDRTKLQNHRRDLEAQHALLKKEIQDLEELGAHALLQHDAKLKSLKKKKLGIKDKLTSLAGLLSKEGLARDSTTSCTTSSTKVPKKLGEGACGSVVLGKDISTGEEVAIKFEPVTREMNERGELSRVALEFHILRSLKGVTGFPQPKYFGTQHIMGRESDFMVMDRLGPSLEDVWWAETGGAGGLGVTSVLNLAAQMLELLRQLHQRGYVHRDLKPENFLLGNKGTTERILHLIDLGIARRAPDCSSAGCEVGINGVAVGVGVGGGIGIATTQDQMEFAGTCRYASARAHRCLEVGRGDDVEALVYTLVFLLKGCLPWDMQGVVDFGLFVQVVGTQKEGLLARLPEREDDLKRGIAQGRYNIVQDLPFEIAEMLLKLMMHTKSVPLEGMPDYKYCHKLIQKAQSEHIRLCKEEQEQGREGGEGNLTSVIAS